MGKAWFMTPMEYKPNGRSIMPPMEYILNGKGMVL